MCACWWKQSILRFTLVLCVDSSWATTFADLLYAWMTNTLSSTWRTECAPLTLSRTFYGWRLISMLGKTQNFRHRDCDAWIQHEIGCEIRRIGYQAWIQKGRFLKSYISESIIHGEEIYFAVFGCSVSAKQNSLQHLFRIKSQHFGAPDDTKLLNTTSLQSLTTLGPVITALTDGKTSGGDNAELRREMRMSGWASDLWTTGQNNSTMNPRMKFSISRSPYVMRHRAQMHMRYAQWCQYMFLTSGFYGISSRK